MSVSDGLTSTSTDKLRAFWFWLSLPTGMYTITPSAAGVVFVPAGISVTLGASAAGVNFQAYLLNQLLVLAPTGSSLHLQIAGPVGKGEVLEFSTDLFHWTPVLSDQRSWQATACADFLVPQQLLSTRPLFPNAVSVRSSKQNGVARFARKRSSSSLLCRSDGCRPNVVGVFTAIFSERRANCFVGTKFSPASPPARPLRPTQKLGFFKPSGICALTLAKRSSRLSKSITRTINRAGYRTMSGETWSVLKRSTTSCQPPASGRICIFRVSRYGFQLKPIGHFPIGQILEQDQDVRRVSLFVLMARYRPRISAFTKSPLTLISLNNLRFVGSKWLFR